MAGEWQGTEIYWAEHPQPAGAVKHAVLRDEHPLCARVGASVARVAVHADACDTPAE